MLDPKQVTLKDRYSFQELLDLVEFLASPQGCPWDRVQTHQSIKGSLVEEAWEAVEAIDAEDMPHLQEELGDVLLQSVFHARIAENKNEFTFEDVVSGLAHKLVSRHTHLFGSDQADTPDAVLATWDANKKKEKGLQTLSETLQEVPKSLPALSRAAKLGKRAARVGFEFPTVQEALQKVSEEEQELRETIQRAEGAQRLEEEAGDLLFAAVNVLRLLKVDPELALNRSSEKFIQRMTRVEQLAAEQGKKLEEQSPEALDDLWEAAKKQLRS